MAGLPRLLDVGQCNDAYSVVRIATVLADAFGTDVNGLPAFLSPNVLQYLVDTFDLKSISTVDDDLKSCLEQGK